MNSYDLPKKYEVNLPKVEPTTPDAHNVYVKNQSISTKLLLLRNRNNKKTSLNSISSELVD